jgi:hypothetical protein
MIMRIAALALASLLLVNTADAQLSATATNGWLDFRGSSAGAPNAAGTSVPTGPYLATFSTTSLASAQAKTGLEQFNVFCFDWRGIAGDSRVAVLTLGQAAADADLYGKFRSAANPDGRSVSPADFEQRLRAGAWLTTQFGASTNSWDEKHVALWNVFWDAGTGSPALPNYATYGTGTNGGGATAQQWFADAFVNASSFDAADFRVLKMLDAQGNYDAHAQTFLVRATVPEPSTIVLVAVGIAALGVAARRRTR